MITSTTNVVFGAGPLGLAVARSLLKAGEPVRLVSRSRPQGLPEGAEWLSADLSIPSRAVEAAKGAKCVFHAANAPYDRWPELLVPLWKSITEAASAQDMPLIVADNLYAYGEGVSPLHEDLPWVARTRKGRARIAAAKALMESSAGAKTTLIRSSDFFGPGVGASQIGSRFFRPLAAGKPVLCLGAPEQPHSCVYVEDFARAMILAAGKPQAWGKVWHMPPVEVESIAELARRAAVLAGQPLKLGRMGRVGVAFLSLFIPVLREVLEMLAQVERPFVTDAGRFIQTFGFQPTPVDQAIKETLAWYSSHPSN